MATATVALPPARRRPSYEPAAGRARIPQVCYVKEINNSRLHREVDPKKWRECMALLGLAVMAFAVVLLYARQHLQCVRYGYEIENLKSQQAGLEEWNKRLRYDEAKLENRQRISELAGEKLGLRPRDPSQVIPLERGASGSGAVGEPEFAESVRASAEPVGGLVGGP